MKYKILLIQPDNTMTFEVTGDEAAWDTYNKTVEALGLLAKVWLIDVETSNVIAYSTD